MITCGGGLRTKTGTTEPGASSVRGWAPGKPVPPKEGVDGATMLAAPPGTPNPAAPASISDSPKMARPTSADPSFPIDVTPSRKRSRAEVVVADARRTPAPGVPSRPSDARSPRAYNPSQRYPAARSLASVSVLPDFEGHQYPRRAGPLRKLRDPIRRRVVHDGPA